MPEKPKVEQCCGRVRGEGQWGAFHMRQCSKKATVEREGKWYCKTHDPVARKERNDKSYAAMKDKWAEESARDAFRSAACKVCAGVPTEKLVELGEGWLASHAPTPAPEPTHDFKEKLHQLLIETVRLAIARQDLRDSCGEDLGEDDAVNIAQDTAYAVQGEGTCDNTPIKEFTDVLASAPAAAQGAPDETGWLIEKGQLCLGSSCGKPAWVTFTDPSAVRFARKIDAENMLLSLRGMSDEGAFRSCTINDHMWCTALPSSPVSRKED